MSEIRIDNDGFTLVELMITVAIAGILLTVGIPSFNQAINNGRLTTNINQLVTSFNFARSESIKRNQSVAVRKKSTEWESGWDIFTDNNNNGTKDGDDILLRTFDAMPTGYTLRATAGVNSVIYNSLGTAGASSFVLCDSNDGNSVPEKYTSRLLIINPLGQVRMGVDSDGDGIPEVQNGSEISSCTTSPFT